MLRVFDYLTKKMTLNHSLSAILHICDRKWTHPQTWQYSLTKKENLYWRCKFGCVVEIVLVYFAKKRNSGK